jgi:hypothetical protein
MLREACISRDMECYLKVPQLCLVLKKKKRKKIFGIVIQLETPDVDMVIG